MTGVREPVLLLHGQPGRAADWRGVVAALGPEVRTLVPDRPGWDGATPARGLAGNGKAVLEMLDRSEVERARVVGHSFGGGIACWLAANAPERVSSLVLVAPAANLASLYRADRWLATPLVGSVAAAGMLGSAGLLLGVGHARSALAHRLRLPEDYLRDVGRGLRAPGAWRSFATEQRALLLELPALEAQLPAIAAPADVVVGAEDRVLPPGSSQELAHRLPGARLVVLDGVGHLVPMFAAERLAGIIHPQGVPGNASG